MTTAIPVIQASDVTKYLTETVRGSSFPNLTTQYATEIVSCPTCEGGVSTRTAPVTLTETSTHIVSERIETKSNGSTVLESTTDLATYYITETVSCATCTGGMSTRTIPVAITSGTDVREYVTQFISESAEVANPSDVANPTVYTTETIPCSTCPEGVSTGTFPVVVTSATSVTSYVTQYVSGAATENVAEVQSSATNKSLETIYTTKTVPCATCASGYTVTTQIIATTKAPELYTSYKTVTIPCQHTEICSGKSYMLSTMTITGTVEPTLIPYTSYKTITVPCHHTEICSGKSYLVSTMTITGVREMPTSNTVIASHNEASLIPYTSYKTVTVPCEHTELCSGKSYVLSTMTITGVQKATATSSLTPLLYTSYKTVTIPCEHTEVCSGKSYLLSTMTITGTSYEPSGREEVITSVFPGTTIPGSTSCTTITVPCTAQSCSTDQYITTMTITVPTASYSGRKFFRLLLL